MNRLHARDMVGRMLEINLEPCESQSGRAGETCLLEVNEPAPRCVVRAGECPPGLVRRLLAALGIALAEAADDGYREGSDVVASPARVERFELTLTISVESALNSVRNARGEIMGWRDRHGAVLRPVLALERRLLPDRDDAEDFSSYEHLVAIGINQLDADCSIVITDGEHSR